MNPSPEFSGHGGSFVEDENPCTSEQRTGTAEELPLADLGERLRFQRFGIYRVLKVGFLGVLAHVAFFWFRTLEDFRLRGLGFRAQGLALKLKKLKELKSAVHMLSCSGGTYHAA